MEINKILRKSGWIILILLSILPFGLWFLSSPRFSSLASILQGIGDITGLCGMTMFSLVIILSARLKFFERFFNGINELYVAHHVFGGLSFCLLLFHPLFLVYNYALSINGAILFFLPSDNFVKNAGILSLLIMIATLFITFYTKIKYQIWKFTHKFLGIAFIFAFIHTFLVQSEIAVNIILRNYLFILGVLAIIAYLYRAIFARLLVKSYKYTVKNIVSLPDKTWEIEFQPSKNEMQFVAGQFVFLTLYNNNLSKESHPFSISSASGHSLKIAIKELGDYTSKLSNIKIGDLAKIEGPFGVFNFKNHSNKKQVWIAGGVGITPFLGMLRSITEEDSDYEIDLYYSVKDEDCLCFKNEIEEIGKKYPNININLWNTKERNFLNAESIKTEVNDLFEKDILICGPPVMMGSLKNQFLKMGIHKNNIYTEEFQLY